MKKYNVEIKSKENGELTIYDFKLFLEAKTFEEKIKIISNHSLQNNLRIKGVKNMEKTQKDFEMEIEEMNKQFSEFLHTKGIKAKFKLAFDNMKDSAKKQHEIDKANFQEVKQKSMEDNKEFVEFLQTKGFKAKVKLVIENIKKGAKESNAKTKEQIAKVKAQTQANIHNAQYGVNPLNEVEVTPEMIEKAFMEFLTNKGLDNKYSVQVVGEE
ncbi:MAG: hypothetical protein IJW82_07785 [Clostridia bacterium]|nr:hypothetical protein [Clostridia bacterium]